MKKLYIPLLAVIFFVSESIFVSISGQVFSTDYILVPRFLFMFLVFLVAYSNIRVALIYSVITGFIFDVTYTEIWGIYLFALPLITYMMKKAMTVLQNNIFTLSLLSIVSVIVIEFVSYFMNSILGFVSMTFQEYTTIRLLPTLLLNTIVIVVLAYPLKKVMIKYVNVDSQDRMFGKKV